jgi:CHAP domain
MRTLYGYRRPALSALFLTVLLARCLSATAGATSGLPVGCRTDCATPYGEVLGVAPQHTPAFSNCNSGCVMPSPSTEHGVLTGIKWQCVEFARRWLLDHLGVVYGDVDVAADLWDKIQSVTRIADGKSLPMKIFLNGAGQPPEVGDLLIYGREYLGTGHVAVITEVDLKSGRLKVAEQNFLNRRWPGDYARQIDLVAKNGRYWVLDPYLLGWKRVEIR